MVYDYLGNIEMVALWTAFLALGALMVAVCLAAYAYFAMAFMTIAQKLKYKRAWLAWIPFANIAMIFQLGGFHWAWIFLLLIPIAGWIAVLALVIVSGWKIFEKRRYPGWLNITLVFLVVPGLSLFAVIAYAIIVGFVAWKKN